jgi:serine/threonine protein kinase
MKRPQQLRLSELSDEGTNMEDSFAIHNGNFVKGNVEISGSGVVLTTERTKSYQGLRGDDFQLISVIGKGTSSQVKLVRHLNGTMMALKVINVYERSKRQQIMEEITALYHAECPCLVGFYGAFFHEGSISIALEYMDQGCIGTVLQRYQKIPEKALAAMTFQVLWGLAYLRWAKRVHRDIKPQNILCNSRGEVKLTDFGISKELENSIGLCQTFVGTFKYMSPERMQSCPYSYASDIWSLGLVLLECVLGRYPYPECRTYIDMVQTVLEAPPPVPPPGVLSGEFIDFVSCCLKKDPKQRVSRAEVLLGAPWLAAQGATTENDVSANRIFASQAIVRAWFQSFQAPPPQQQQTPMQQPPPQQQQQQQQQYHQPQPSQPAAQHHHHNHHLHHAQHQQQQQQQQQQQLLQQQAMQQPLQQHAQQPMQPM